MKTIQNAISTLEPAKGIIIGGQALAAEATFNVLDPATTELIAEVADGTSSDAVLAVDAASRAYAPWAATAPRERAEILRRAYDLMIAATDDLASLISLENGKSLDDARDEITYAAEFFRWFSEESVRSEGDYSTSPGGRTRTIVTHKPAGIAVLATPWNFPAAMATRKLAPALAAGCTLVLKPAAETPLTAIAITHILKGAGVPDGVVNLVPTTDPASVVSTWISDERITKLSFTGSTGVGRTLLRQAADRVLNVSMELGGNAPFIVTADAHVPEAVAGAMIAKFRNGGQACTAANRFYIHEHIADEFIDQFGAAIDALRVGPGRIASTQVGPLITERAVTAVAELVRSAVADGARIANQAPTPGGGFYYPPTLLTDVDPGSAILRKEIFGPVAPVVTWTDEDEMIRQANDTEFGLASYVYAGNLQSAVAIAERLDTGMVGINRGLVSDPAAPFGGTRQSGIGREGAREGLRAFQETQYFSVDWP